MRCTSAARHCSAGARGASSLDVAHALADLGAFLADTIGVRVEHRDEAQAVLELALNILTLKGALHSTEASMTYHNLGTMRHMKGENEEALKLLHRSLALDRVLLPGDHPDIAKTLAVMSVCSSELGLHGQAAVAATASYAVSGVPSRCAHCSGASER